MGPAEFFVKYWDWCLLVLLVLNTLFQHMKWKGAQDLLSVVWEGIKAIASSKPGKLLLLVGFSFLFLATQALTATNVTFNWDANTEQDLAGYRLYQSDTSGVYTFGAGNEIKDINAGVETVVIGDIPDGTYYWVLTAYDTGGKESGPSNEVTAILDAAPGCPKNFNFTF